MTNQTIQLFLLSQFFIFSILCQNNISIIPNDFELIFVHSVWRHGDRSIADPLKHDLVKADDWVSGGGGYGQLSAIGMADLFKFGSLLRKRYITTTFPRFLHPFYDSKQVFIRSTDINRTINSAVANMIGMFSSDNSDARPGIDYPDIPGWPRGFMPVPIHAPVEKKKDYILYSFFPCKRRDALIKMGTTTDQYRSMANSTKFIEMSKKLKEIFETEATIENLFKFGDAIVAETVHFPEILKAQSWYTPEFVKDLETLRGKANRFVTGLYDPPVVDGIDLRTEILKTKAGLLANEIADRMRTISSCWKNGMKCDSYHSKLRFYGYSAHDFTLITMLSVLGLESIVAGKENIGIWPEYSASLTIELFGNKADKRTYFRALYHRNSNSTFEDVTKNIRGCEKSDFCDLQVFENFAKKHRPDRPLPELCAIMPGHEEDNIVQRMYYSVISDDTTRTKPTLLGFSAIILFILWVF